MRALILYLGIYTIRSITEDNYYKKTKYNGLVKKFSLKTGNIPTSRKHESATA